MGKTVTINRTRITSLLAALFIAANISLPHLFHLIPGGGVMFLPIYFFTAFAAVCFGRTMGILTAMFSPLTGYLMFGMPRAALLPDMILKGVLLSVVLSVLLSRASTMTLRVAMIPLGVLLAWTVAGILELSFMSYEIAFQDFFTGIPGLVLMTIAGWLALFYNNRIAQ